MIEGWARLEPDQSAGAPIMKPEIMRPPRPKLEMQKPLRPSPDRPPLRPRTLLHWLLERLCIFPSAD
jgi:hypothetical protein